MELGFRLYFTDKTIYISQSTLSCVHEGTDTIYSTNIEGVKVSWCFRPYEQGTLITLTVCAQRALGITRIDSVVFAEEVPKETARMVFLGGDMYANEIRYPSELGTGQEYSINCVGHFEHLAAKGILLAGVAPFINVYGSVLYKKEDGSFEFRAKTEFPKGMLKEKELHAETVYLRENVTIDDFFTAYRNLLPTSSFPMPKLTGWNTWDYYLDKVTPEDIAENVTALKSMPFAKCLNYIVLDDGWQKEWGDWTENNKFACGLTEVAGMIRDAGFIPGIWMTPVGIKKTASVFREHPEWLCRNEEGEPLYEMGLYYLDPTHPEAEQYILDCYRYQYLAGFRLFKMDYVSPLLHVKNFYDKTATPYQVLSQLVQKVQKCTGEDVVVLGCSLPPECGADIAPSMRIGVDIHNHFSHVVWIAQALTWTWMYNNKITRIDPDFLIVRGEETAKEPIVWEGGKRNDFIPPARHLQTDKDRFQSRWRHGAQFNAVEAETWANLVAISGGNIFLSDRMSMLNEKGISIIQNAMQLAGEEVRPHYQKEDKRLPSVWQGDKGILIVNWEDIPRNLSFSGIARPIVSDKEFVLKGDTITVTLLPHESFAAIYLE